MDFFGCNFVLEVEFGLDFFVSSICGWGGFG